jgi:hypothetical protein
MKSWPILRYYMNICPEGIKELTRNRDTRNTAFRFESEIFRIGNANTSHYTAMFGYPSSQETG